MDSDPCAWTALEQRDAIRKRHVSSRELVGAHLDRIAEVNPHVNAIVTLLPEEAMAAAGRADERTVSGAELGPLHGLPMAHKDTHLTAGIRTTFGSPLRADLVPEQDELVIARLRGAGVVTTGKTNVPEFGAGSHTFNPLFGATRNPYDLNRSAGGSSGGAAAALATGMQSIADGSDMGGSLRNPAAWCNVVGLRPSPGRVPSHPTSSAWEPLVVQGPMGRTVSDVALLLSVMAGPDPRSPVSLEAPGDVFAASLEGDVRGLRVACSADLGGAVPIEPALADNVRVQALLFESMGATVEEASPTFEGADDVFRTMRAWHLLRLLGDLDDRHPGALKTSLSENVAAGRRLTVDDLRRAETWRTVLHHEMGAFFEKYDVLLLPVTQVTPFAVELEYPSEVAGVVQDDYLGWMRSAYLVSATAHPAISVPAGFTSDGLPVGLQIVGGHRADLQLLRVAHAYEAATGHGRVAPRRAVGVA